jgi:CRP-like cAMP-binding protein
MFAGFSESIPDRQLATEFGKDCKELKVTRRKVLFRQGDVPLRMYLLKSGTVTLTMKIPVTGEALGFTAQQGYIIGLPAVAGGHPYSMTATALSGAELCEITRDHFRLVISSNPELSFRILQILANEVHSTRRLIGRVLSGLTSSNGIPHDQKLEPE